MTKSSVASIAADSGLTGSHPVPLAMNKNRGIKRGHSAEMNGCLKSGQAQGCLSAQRRVYSHALTSGDPPSEPESARAVGHADRGVGRRSPSQGHPATPHLLSPVVLRRLVQRLSPGLARAPSRPGKIAGDDRTYRQGSPVLAQHMLATAMTTGERHQLAAAMRAAHLMIRRRLEIRVLNHSYALDPLGKCVDHSTMSSISPIIETLRARVSIAPLIGETVKVLRSGEEERGECPAHRDFERSLVVLDAKGFFRCYRCRW